MSLTKTRVVNLRRDAYQVYVGRAGKGRDGYFGNPFRVTDEESLRTALEKYLEYFYEKLLKDPTFKRRVEELRGKVLGCFCAPAGGLTAEDMPFRCHGQVIAEYLDVVSRGITS